MQAKVEMTNIRVPRALVRVLKHNANLWNQSLGQYTRLALEAGVLSLGGTTELPDMGEGGDRAAPAEGEISVILRAREGAV